MIARTARRIYREAHVGQPTRLAIARLAHSADLARAVAAADPAAVQRELWRLIRGHVTAIRVTQGGIVLGEAGSRAALAPTSGVIRSGSRAVGEYVFSVISEDAFAQLLHHITSAQVAFTSGSEVALTGPASGTGSQITGMRALAYPGSRIGIALVTPALAPGRCLVDAPTAALLSLRDEAQRLYATEATGPSVERLLRKVRHFRPLVHAVRARDGAAERRAVLALFAAHLHLVRARIVASGQPVVDVGGPYALAPVTTALPSTPGARVTVSLQDDIGYVRLIRRYLGLRSVLAVGGRALFGGAPGGLTLPDQGPLVALGRRYVVTSFEVGAFPSGDLHVSLLVPAGLGA